ncbi:hypothetical protein [Vibrio vulnificus]|uniref:hypothetical protein n=1 Tax=Vibrio vulnificus TaxID=672 RepID=UPI003242FAA8
MKYTSKQISDVFNALKNCDTNITRASREVDDMFKASLDMVKITSDELKTIRSKADDGNVDIDQYELRIRNQISETLDKLETVLSETLPTLKEFNKNYKEIIKTLSEGDNDD